LATFSKAPPPRLLRRSSLSLSADRSEAADLFMMPASMFLYPLERFFLRCGAADVALAVAVRQGLVVDSHVCDAQLRTSPVALLATLPSRSCRVRFFDAVLADVATAVAGTTAAVAALLEGVGLVAVVVVVAGEAEAAWAVLFCCFFFMCTMKHCEQKPQVAEEPKNPQPILQRALSSCFLVAVLLIVVVLLVCLLLLML